MIDPITAVAAATAAFNTIKKGFEADSYTHLTLPTTVIV